MGEDFLTQERIRRLQIMGIAVWQERGKRAPVAAVTHDPDASKAAIAPPPVAPSRTPRTPQPARTVASGLVTTPNAPPPVVTDADWQQLRAAVSSCTACGLCESRTQTVFGVGLESADVMVIGEAPGAEEDRKGEPFVGHAGQLLDAMLLSIGINRSTVFIANVVKCRPPGNRDPQSTELAQCAAYLNRQIELVKPKVLIAAGRTAAQRLLGSKASLARLRGKLHHYGENKIPLIVTYHPAYLLRSPEQKRKAWEDLLMSQQLIEGNAP